jgi:predicted Zn-dependent peptidase
MNTNYTAQNTILSVAGVSNHEEIVSAAKSLVLSVANSTAKNAEKPEFTPSTLFMRDDEMVNVNFGVFFKAPTWKDPEFFAMHYLQAIMGEYRAD